MSKKDLFSFNKTQVAVIIFFLSAAALLYLCTKLFFYDEDIFVADPHNNFMSDLTRGSTVKLSFLSDNFFYKTSATGYHVTNVLLHLFNTIIATYTFRTLLKYVNPAQLKTDYTCYIFFLHFLLSPIHSEPLCYLLGRAGLIVTLFCTLALLFFLKANFSRLGLLIVSLLFFLLALFSYEISWTLPFIILAIAYYLKIRLTLKNKPVISYVAPYFILFALWFLIKIIFIDKLEITPYGNGVFLSPGILHLIKNCIVLFFRNFIPPFQSTAIFISLSVIAALLFIYFLFIMKNKNRHLFFFCLLIIGAWFLAYSPAVVFGINSHNSESERYIYFSSVFAIMFLAIVLSSVRNQKTMMVALPVAICIYTGFLFSTINDYINGGNFSKDYLKVLTEVNSSEKPIYLINQPSQYKGALLFRAYSNKKGSSQKNLYTINDYMHTLNSSNIQDYITLSKKEISKNDAISNVVVTSSDSILPVFPEFDFDRSNQFLLNSKTGDSVLLEKHNSIIIGLKPPSVYIFK
ncbi:MAG: hypothetical protein ABIN97_07675 [Ginsengibacter sp.]